MSDRKLLLMYTSLVLLGTMALWYCPREREMVDHHPLVEYADGYVGGGERSPKWRATANAWRKGQPVCQRCGSSVDLNVHHIVPFSEDPAKELDPTNFITLCRECHFDPAHEGNWKKINPSIREEAARHLIKLYGPRE